MTREDWLNSFIAAARPQFEKLGFPIPELVRASIGFPSAGAKGKAVGECWSNTSSKDDAFEIFLHPGRSDTAEVAGALSHELVHAAVGLDAKHGPPVPQGSCRAGPDGQDDGHHARPRLVRVGAADPRSAWPPAPRRAGDGRVSSSRGPAQKNRHLKLTCNACGISLRGTRKQIESVVYLQCVNPDCDGEMEME